MSTPEIKKDIVVGLSHELIQKLESTAEKLIADRKVQKPPTDYTSKKEIAQFKV